MNKILITGGAGFIGTQVAHELGGAGYQVTIVDRKINQPSWYKSFIVHECDYEDFINTSDEKFDFVIHLAAEHIVGDSVKYPEKFYENNVIKTKQLLDYMVDCGIKNIIFSSTGAVYGSQSCDPLAESMNYCPENPYASTKVSCELLIRDYANAYNINYVNFRFFNAAGADPRGRFGYIQNPATHVMPILCDKLLNGGIFYINGNDYNTPDGTCLRDYVHVADLARAHLNAIDFLKHDKNITVNLGGGVGVSVYDLVKLSSNVAGKTADIFFRGRRPGDAESLVSDIGLAKKYLKWSPHYSVEDAFQHAWNWEKTRMLSRKML